MRDKRSLEDLRLERTFVDQLPGDPSEVNRPRQVREACYSKVEPTPVPGPRLLAYAAEVLADLGLGSLDLEDPESRESFARVFGGSRLVPGMAPYAACYGGHQFGNWAGQLGDGRAITLGEVVPRDGQGRLELQLKGAGPTPYSRHADGRAVLRSSVREFLCSEAMHHLGVPTTRALSLVTTGEQIERDMFYDGRPEMEPGAVVCRVAPSFLRLGSFEIFTARGETEVLGQLASYALRHHFPELLPADQDPQGVPPASVVVAWLREVCRRTAVMIAHWMRVGFVHGVMNTDNLSILGLTIDYGPYGWLENYDPDWTPNTTDAGGRRYRFGHQPGIALWNLARFAEALYPLVGDIAPLEDALETYKETFERTSRRMTASKLGLLELRDEDDGLVEDLLKVLRITETDMTIFYRRLAEVPGGDAGEVRPEDLLAPLMDAYYLTEDAAREEPRRRTLEWLGRYRRRLAEDGLPNDERKRRMHRANPRYVLRNYLAQLAIRKAETGDSSGVLELQGALRRPYDERPEHEHLAARRPDWARTEPGCSMLSCSS